MKLADRRLLSGMVIALALPAVAAASNPGDLDPTFNSGGAMPGVFTKPVTGSSSTFLSGLVTSADSRVRATGFSFDGTAHQQFTTFGVTPGGTADPLFGSSGLVLSSPDAPADSEATAIAAAPGGTYVIVGTATPSPGHARIVVQRMLANGAPDTTFGPTHTGSYEYPIQCATCAGPPVSYDTRANAVAVDATGRIYVAGSGHSNSAPDKAFVIRLTAAGLLDTGAFNAPNGGIGFPLSGAEAHGSLQSVALAPGGGVFVAGGYQCGTCTVVSNVGAVAKIKDDGTLDTGFDVDGIATTQLSTSPAGDENQTFLQSVVAGSDGKPIAAGYATYSEVNGEFDHNVYQAVAERWGADGLPDAGFGTAGVLRHQFGADALNGHLADSEAYAAALEPDGRVILAGSAGNADDTDANGQVLLARLLADGELDPAFGGGTGYTVTAMGPVGDGSAPGQFDSIAHGVTLSPQHRIDVTGWADTAANTTQAMVARFYDTPSPSAKITASATSTVVGATVTFDGSGSSGVDAPIVSYSWDLNGDGTFGDATGPSAATTFTTPGTHHVSLAVIDANGLTASNAIAVNVIVPIVFPLPKKLIKLHITLPTLLLKPPTAASFALPVQCPTDGGTCKGTIAWLKAAGHTHAAKTTTLARGSFTIAAGRKRSVRVTLTAAGRRAVKGHKKVSVPLTIKLTQTGAATVLVHKTITLTLPKPKKHH